MSDAYDSSIPVLNDVLVRGDPAHARGGSLARSPVLPAPVHDADPDPNAPVASFVPPPSDAPALAAADLRGYDPEALAERLRGRFASYLTGEGRGVIEARCRDALNEHSTWLVNQITREVALALETELTEWVRDAVREELARRH